MSASGETTPAAMTGSRRWSDLGTRTASAVVMVILALATTHKGGALFVLFWLAASVAILWEWQRLIGGTMLFARVSIGSVVLAFAALYASRLDAMLAILIVVVGAAAMAALAGSGKRVWAAGGMLYAGLLLVAVASLRESFPFGARSIVWLFATVWATDCFAYFGGRLIGGPKLWPRISPSKTWSGTMTGVIAGGLIGSYVALRGLPEPWAVGPILLLSFATAALSQAGDALESGIKRHFGVKDSSRLIPGHGGIMDRLDGFVAASIFALAVGLIRNVPSIAGGLFYWA
ncbi:phosphatidate cytidylyltransferase [Beijerinckia sp. L45]|uniref:phosphatidate cytidylyltransferase n=1 Tax=Beijerinckia sp. L45 TaxID=1641855 RepID=UPI00131C38F5|nr:phosphatidate cytidylyltransferase [Beijerinckia sp. L45]